MRPSLVVEVRSMIFFSIYCVSFVVLLSRPFALVSRASGRGPILSFFIVGSNPTVVVGIFGVFVCSWIG